MTKDDDLQNDFNIRPSYEAEVEPLVAQPRGGSGLGLPLPNPLKEACALSRIATASYEYHIGRRT